MNNQQKEMQRLSYQLGLKTLSEALEKAEKLSDEQKVSEILAQMEKLINENERYHNEEKIWLH
jgi:soluble cytochrome b562